MLVAFSSSRDGDVAHVQSSTHVHVYACVQELVAAKLPKLAAHLKELNCDMTLIATDWFLCLFATVLPSEVIASSSFPLVCRTPCIASSIGQMFE